MGKLTRAQRADLRMMFNGRCAYCGTTLPDRWHADHIEPVLRTGWIAKFAKVDAAARRPENERPDNYFPACPQCNISKGAMQLDEWRKWLAGHLVSLNRDHSIYRLSKAFGLVTETGKRVEFYFERPSDA